MSLKDQVRDAQYRLVLADQLEGDLDGHADITESTRQSEFARAHDIRIAAESDLALHGNAVITVGGEDVGELSQTPAHLKTRLAHRSKVTTAAAIERLDLLVNADVFEMALDTAESVGADNAVEKMLAHQMAAAHKTSMDLLEQNRRCNDPVAEVRRLNAAARLMVVLQQAAVTLQRLRLGGHQTVTVKHITVESGAQAVIGNVGGPASDRLAG